MAINDKIDYKSYFKYFLLYEAVMGSQKIWMRWLKVLLESSEKTLQAMWAAARPPSPVSSMPLLLKGRAARGKQKKTIPQDDRQLCRIAKTNRFSWATQLFQLSQKWSCALRREVPTTTTFRRLREMGFCCCKHAIKPLLNCKHKLKRLQWANMHKNAERLDVWTIVKSHF